MEVDEEAEGEEEDDEEDGEESDEWIAVLVRMVVLLSFHALDTVNALNSTLAALIKGKILRIANISIIPPRKTGIPGKKARYDTQVILYKSHLIPLQT